MGNDVTPQRRSLRGIGVRDDRISNGPRPSVPSRAIVDGFTPRQAAYFYLMLGTRSSVHLSEEYIRTTKRHAQCRCDDWGISC